MLPSEQSVASKEAGARCSTELFRPGVSVKRDVGTPTGALRAKGAPIDRRIENVCAVGGRPLKPGVCFATGPEAFSDHEPDIFGPARMHRVIKGDSLSLTIGKSAGLDFIRCFPFHGKTVGNCT
jgi:hypothetical protein